MNPNLWRFQIRIRKLLCRHRWKASPFRALNNPTAGPDYICPKCGAYRKQGGDA